MGLLGGPPVCYVVLHCRFPQLQFEYSNPTPGFDCRKVKGPVAKLVRLKDPSTATALEVTAGGKVRRGAI